MLKKKRPDPARRLDAGYIKEDVIGAELFSILEDEMFELATPPWRMKAEAWWFLLSILGHGAEWINRSADNKGHRIAQLGPAHFDPLEHKHQELATKAGVSQGGFGSVQLIRYYQSPVGPYDELLIIPGQFKLPIELDGPQAAARITRIYVSSLQSVYNGRQHWNIPKHLARFEFKGVEGSKHVQMVRIYSMESFSFTPNTSSQGWNFEPKFSSEPFFSTAIRHHLPLLSLPVNMKWLKLFNIPLYQPPLEAACAEFPQDAQQNCGLVGTKEWKSMIPGIKGKVSLCSFKGTLLGREGQYADGKHFPDFIAYRFGLYWQKLELDFPTGKSVQQASHRRGLHG